MRETLMCDPNWKGVVDDLVLVVKCQLCGVKGHSANRCPNVTHTPLQEFSMVKRRRILVNLSLPEVIIQRIQSFMIGKEAAQTSILSKSWYNAWLTRPNLDFTEHHEYSRNQQDHEDFLVFVKKTFRRYEELSLKIESFRLCIYRMNSHSSLAEELIVKAMKMGAVDFDFGVEGYFGLGSFTLPCMVLESENLIRLSVAGIKLKNGKVSCSRLGSLSLEEVSVVDDNIIWDIISSCPLIEELTLSRCSGTQGSLIRLAVDAPCNLSCLYKLKSLFLVDVNVDPLFFSDVLSNFPCLKVLSVDNCGGYNYKGIKLSSHSLERIAFRQTRVFRAKFDIPSIRKFEFQGSRWPSVSFKTASRNWESHVSLNMAFSTGWSRKLQELLTSLSWSKISLSLTISCIKEAPVNYFQNLPKTEVENLTMRASCNPTRSEGVKYLFQVCRPKFITLYLFPDELRNGGEKKRSLQEIRKSGLMEDTNMFDLHDLKEVNAQLFKKSSANRWLLSRSESLLSDWSTDENKPHIRFRLRWAVDPVSLN